MFIETNKAKGKIPIRVDKVLLDDKKPRFLMDEALLISKVVNPASGMAAMCKS